MFERALIPPQQWLERKSTGLTTLGMAGNRSRKSSSAGSICLFMSKTCKKIEGRRGKGPIEGRVGRKERRKDGKNREKKRERIVEWEETRGKATRL